MVTGERGQRAAAMMVGEMDRRKTADAVKAFLLGVERCCGEPSWTRGGRTRPLNRILELMSMHLTGVYLLGMKLMGVHLMGVHLTVASEIGLGRPN